MNSILKQAGLRQAEANYPAYSPDLPGCVATGKSSSEAKRNMRRAIDLHVQGLADDDTAMPEPRSSAGYVTVDR